MAASWELTDEMFLSLKEVDVLLDRVRNKRERQTGRALASAELDRLVVELLLFSGLRTTECCRLTLANTILGTGHSSVEVTGMQGRDRTVFLPSSVSNLVKQFVTGPRRMFLPDDVDPDDLTQPLLFGERKKPYERTGLYRRVVRVLSAAGLGDRASVQLLRHTYGYLAYVRTGGNLLFVQRQLGHAHPMVTMVYARFVDESYESLAEAVDHRPSEMRKRTKRNTSSSARRQ